MARGYQFWVAAFLVAAACYLAPPAVQADPIAIGGGVRTSPSFPIPDTYTLVVSTVSYPTGSAVTDRLFYLPIPGVPTAGEQLCVPCTPGQVIDITTTFALGGADFVGSAELGGLPHPRVVGEGELTFHTSPATVPANSGTVFLVPPIPLTATGFLRFIDQDTSELLFESEVTGSGSAFLFLVGAQGGDFGGPYSFFSANYILSDPVPEPGTLLLVGTGALLLIRSRRSRPARPRERDFRP